MDSLLSRPENFIIPGLPPEVAVYAGMIFVPGGTFRMGSRPDDPQADEDEKPAHDVSVLPFFIGQFPVTQALWKAVMNGETPAWFPGENRPVEQVSWDDIRERFLPALHEALKNTALGVIFRLPTEAEWEYAARGGPHWQDGFLYSGSDKLKEVGWFGDNSHGQTKPVGLKYPNQLGLYDMSGNVWEWCHDWYDSEYYKKCTKGGLVPNPQGPDEGVRRVQRGGCRWLSASLCRTASRDFYRPAYRARDFGFRLAASFLAVD